MEKRRNCETYGRLAHLHGGGTASLATAEDSLVGVGAHEPGLSPSTAELLLQLAELLLQCFVATSSSLKALQQIGLADYRRLGRVPSQRSFPCS